jgi:topoisomerase IA-like protein
MSLKIYTEDNAKLPSNASLAAIKRKYALAFLSDLRTKFRETIKYIVKNK